MGLARRVGSLFVLPVARRSRLLRELATYIEDHLGSNGYGALRERFVKNGRSGRWNEGVRTELVERFECIHQNVAIHSSRTDALFWAEALLSLDGDGDIVECGCFAGGTTAKLSILAKMLGKALLVFDSFEGLPESSTAQPVDYHSRLTTGFNWRPGACLASLAEVRTNVEKYGEPSACTFIEGWFGETLIPDHLPEKVSFALTDVVLASSARECMRAIWPRIPDGGVYFSRDVAFTRVLQSLFDEPLWREMGDFPPIFFGAGYGLRDSSPHLGFMIKGHALQAAYIDSLMLEKAGTSVT